MAVTGYKGCYIAVLIGGNTFKWKFIERDEEIISILIRLETAFWQGIQDNIPPALDGSDASSKFINERFPNSRPLSTVALPITAANLLHQYDAACEQLDRLTEQKIEAENLLKQMMGDNEAGIIGERLITWKSFTQERLDTKTFKTKHPKLYKRYINKTSSRRFSVKAAG